MNKKAYMKTLEAIIAIVVFLSVLVFTISSTRDNEPLIPQDIQLVQDTILSSIETGEKLREESFNNNLTEINNFINATTPLNMVYNYSLCIDNPACPIPTTDLSEKVYADSLIMVEDSKVVLINLIIWKTI